MTTSVPQKASRVLNVIILGIFLIFIRVWYLAVIQREELVEQAHKPQRKTIAEPVERATIRDRFNLPLAYNQVQYNAAVCFAEIRDLPGGKWEINSEGKRVRIPVRTAYIEKLAKLLAVELNMNPEQIEDTIHGKASLFPHTPFIIKENLSEAEYYRLKMLEKDWVGIHTELGSKRYYPRQKTACDVIGYMGAISSSEYYKIASEMATLQTYLQQREEGETPFLPKGFENPLEVRERLKQLQEKSYTINALVGKMGIEGGFDAELRGYSGKKLYEVDRRGNLIRELPGSRAPLSGQRILLSLSLELQEYAEELLANYEKIREGSRSVGSLKEPWIRGGAIVAIDPNNGEVLALASYPRMNPQDFLPSRTADKESSLQLNRWLESEAYTGAIWDGRRSLERERFNEATGSFYEETLPLTFENYLTAILPDDSEILASLQRLHSIENTLHFLNNIEKLLPLSGQSHLPTLLAVLYEETPHLRGGVALAESELKSARATLVQHAGQMALLKKEIDPYLQPILRLDDKLLLLDLCRLFTPPLETSDELVTAFGGLSLSDYRLYSQAALRIVAELNTQAKKWFHDEGFKQWRMEHFKEYLKEKRKEEKEKRKYAKPYTDYLEACEKKQFREFWQNERTSFLHAFILYSNTSDDPYLSKVNKLRANASASLQRSAESLKSLLEPLSPELQSSFFKTIRSFDELNSPLLGKYRMVRNTQGVQLEKHLAGAFYPLMGYGYGRSQAFRQSTPHGSVFKLVVAYQTLLEKFEVLKEQIRVAEELNPLVLVDDLRWEGRAGRHDQILGFTAEQQPITRLYKGGILPRSSHAGIGRVDLIGAIEKSSNIYFSLLASEHISDPNNLIEAAKSFGFGSKTGIELPGEISGSLPDDLSFNLSGLYAAAIGQHSLIVTPLQSAQMMCCIANEGKLIRPTIVQAIAGQEPLREYRDPFDQQNFLFQENLELIGIQFPLFTATQQESTAPYVWCNASEIKRTLYFPEQIHQLMVSGMYRVINSPGGTARPGAIRALHGNPEWRKNYIEIGRHMLGKTGTAEIMYKHSIDAVTKAEIRNHISFAGISYKPQTPQNWEHPELVVVVYLRFSEAGGKEAAPIATQIIKKWREICAKHGKSAYFIPEIATEGESKQ